MTAARQLSQRGDIGADGAFVRPRSRFRHWVTGDGPFGVESGRYHLYVAGPCCWSHRTLIARRLMGLEAAISASYVDPIRGQQGWHFSGGKYTDAVNDFALLSEAYEASEVAYEGRVSVPVLWDRDRREIVNNESADIMRMFARAFAPLAEHPVDLYPAALASDIDALNAYIYENVNDGVYKVGFARRQSVSKHELSALFAALDHLDERVSRTRFLFGDVPVETDWRLFSTLVRFDAVYYPHFQCDLRPLVEYEHLWPYARDLFLWPGVSATVDFEEILAPFRHADASRTDQSPESIFRGFATRSR